MSRLQRPRISIAPALSAPPEFWRAVWRRLEDEGTAQIIFGDGSVRTADEFAEQMDAVHVHPFCIYVEDELAAFVWLTNLEGRMGRGHFAIFRQYMQHARFMGAYAREFLLSTRYENGEYCFDVLVGMVPAENIRAVNVVKKSGFVYNGRIPKGGWMADRRTSIDMLIFTATREDV